MRTDNLKNEDLHLPYFASSLLLRGSKRSEANSSLALYSQSLAREWQYKIRESSSIFTYRRYEMSKHTPGPWNTGDSDIPVSCISVHGDRNGKHSTLARLASADFIGMPVDEALANARLIASAPDLLAALIHCAEDHEMLLRRLDGSFHLSSEAAIALLRNSTEQARHAITNATSS